MTEILQHAMDRLAEVEPAPFESLLLPDDDEHVVAHLDRATERVRPQLPDKSQVREQKPRVPILQQNSRKNEESLKTATTLSFFDSFVWIQGSQ